MKAEDIIVRSVEEINSVRGKSENVVLFNIISILILLMGYSVIGEYFKEYVSSTIWITLFLLLFFLRHIFFSGFFKRYAINQYKHMLAYLGYILTERSFTNGFSAVVYDGYNKPYNPGKSIRPNLLTLKGLEIEQTINFDKFDEFSMPVNCFTVFISNKSALVYDNVFQEWYYFQ